ncbi:MAG: lysophospholipase [Nitrospirae bacterium]|nr:lysophospholipase [Nitrospirota bacterium]
MQPSERILAADKGRKLFCRFWSPERPRALLLIVHGIGEHGGRYRPVAEYFVSRGMAVMVPDQRGSGLSRDEGGVFRYDELLRDVSRMAEEGRRWAGEVPLILLGHSLGALTILKSLPSFRPPGVRGVIFISPALRSRIPRPRLLGVRILGRLLPWFRLTFDAGSFYLTHDPIQVEAHRRDPLINHRFTAGFLRDVLDVMSETRREVRSLPCPALILYAGDDHLVDSAATRLFVERLSGDKEAVCYERGYHEVLNEVNREEVYARMAAWIDRVLPQASPKDPYPKVKT